MYLTSKLHRNGSFMYNIHVEITSKKALKLCIVPVTGGLMTCPSADRLCSIPDRDGPPRPLEASSSELPPSKPGLKLGRLLSPTCINM